MTHLYVLFSHDPTDWISRVMAWFTFGKWSHVALVHGDQVIEASSLGKPRGVRRVSLAEFNDKHPNRVLRKIDHPNPAAVWACAESKIGQPYDYLWIVGWLLRNKKLQRDNAFVCDELVTVCCKEAGYPLFEGEHTWFADSQHLFMISKEI